MSVAKVLAGERSWFIATGDVTEQLRTLPDGCVHCCVTSPPYFGLRDYQTGRWEGGDPACDHKKNGGRSHIDPTSTPQSSHANTNHAQEGYRSACARCGAVRVDRQIGLEATPDAYIARMVEVFREVRRVLRDDGVAFINIGDSYFGSTQTGGTSSKEGSAKRLGRMFTRPSSARRAGPYGTSDTAPGDSPDRDSTSRSLCDGCRAAAGRTSRNGYQPAPTLELSPSDSILERRAGPHDRPPASDSVLRDDHSSAATSGLVPAATLEAAPLPASRESTPPRSAERPLVACSHCANCGACLSVLGSSSRDARLCARRTAAPSAGRSEPSSTSDQLSSTDDTGETDDSSAGRTRGTVSDSAYPDYTRASSLKAKDLIGIPWMLAFALRADGWYLRSDIIWAKKSCMPESVTDRPTSAHEHIFLLSKRERYYYDADAVREPNTDGSLARHAGGIERPHDEAYTAGRHGHRPHEGRLNQNGVYTNGRNQRNVWLLGPESFAAAHFATFPTEIPRRAILAGTSERGCCAECGSPWRRVKAPTPEYAALLGSDWADYAQDATEGRGHSVSDQRPTKRAAPSVSAAYVTTGWKPTCTHPGDPVPAVVLDPFAGSGTTLMTALRHNRRAIGIDLSPEYVALAERRIVGDAPLFNVA